MSKIFVPAPTYAADGSSTRIFTSVRDARLREIWFRINQPYYQISDAQNDAFVLPLYLHALHAGLDLHFEFPVSHRLLSGLSDALGPLLIAFAPDLFSAPISVTASQFLWGPSHGIRPIGSATGMSCGLDSFATVQWASAFPLEGNRRLAALSHFDVGNHGPTGSHDAVLFDRRRVRANEVARRMELPMLDIQSNVGEWIPGGFARLHTLRNAAAAYLLYPYVGTYIYSNGVRIGSTTVAAKDSAYIDALVLPLLSTSYLEFIQGTPAWGAADKMSAILSNPIAQEFLNVCYFEDTNCGICEKCLRRALLIDSFGRLQDFSRVFDLNVFTENRDWYVGYVLMRAHDSPVMRELADHLRTSGYLVKGEMSYRFAWACRRVANRFLRLAGRARRPL